MHRTSLKPWFLGCALICAPTLALAASDLTIDTPSSAVEFTAIGKPGFLRINGHGGKVGGTSASTSGGGLAGTFSADLDAFETGISLRDEHMKTKYLETGKYPRATLVWMTQSAKSGETPFTGTLTLHGVEHPVAGTAKLDGATTGKINVDATFPLKLSDFKIDIPNYHGVTVAEDVIVHVTMTAAEVVKQASH